MRLRYINVTLLKKKDLSDFLDKIEYHDLSFGIIAVPNVYTTFLINRNITHCKIAIDYYGDESCEFFSSKANLYDLHLSMRTNQDQYDFITINEGLKYLGVVSYMLDEKTKIKLEDYKGMDDFEFKVDIETKDIEHTFHDWLSISKKSRLDKKYIH